MLCGKCKSTHYLSKRQLQKINDVPQIVTSGHHYLEELYGGPGSDQFLLLMYQCLLDADAASAHLKVANMCLPNFEQAIKAISFSWRR
jgi:hypothetical protein